MRKNVNEYFKRHKLMVAVWVIITMVLSFLAPLKAFTLQWIIDSSSKRQPGSGNVGKGYGTPACAGLYGFGDYP